MPQDMDMDASNFAGGNVFVSYSRRNLDFANQIVTLLEDEGYDPRIDREDIEVTEKWLARLSELIASSDTVVFVLTDEYLASENCSWEIQEAVKRGKRLIPCLPKPLTTDDVPEDLAALNYIHFFNLKAGDGTGFYDGVKSLKRALRHDLERLRLRRRYEDRAAGWAAGEDDLLSGEQLAQAHSWETATAKVEGVPSNIADYIQASRVAQEKRQKRQQQLSVAFGVLGALAVIATVLAGFSWMAADQREREAELAQSDADKAVESLQVAETDSEQFAGAAVAWAQASASLATSPFERVTTSGQEALDTTDQALTFLTQANDAMASLKKRDAPHILQISNAVARDLAKARFYNGLPSAAEPIDAIIDATLSAYPRMDNGEAPAEIQVQLAKDYLSRAIYACVEDEEGDNAAGGRNEIFDNLAGAPDGIKALFAWADVRRRAAAPAMCEEAYRAICEFARDCTVPTPRRLATPAPDPTAPRRAMRSITIPSEPAPEPAPAPAPTPPENALFNITQVFLHISDEADRTKAEAVGAALSKRYSNLKIMGVELIKSDPGKNRSIRYYYEQQAPQARGFAEACAQIAATEGFDAWGDVDTYRIISLAGRYDGLPPNRAEIWF